MRVAAMRTVIVAIVYMWRRCLAAIGVCDRIHIMHHESISRFDRTRNTVNEQRKAKDENELSALHGLQCNSPLSELPCVLSVTVPGEPRISMSARVTTW